MMKMKVQKELTENEVKTILASDISKSAKIKELFMKGLDVKTIANHMNTRYNFVYNVVSNMVRVNDLESEVIKEDKANKRDEIIKLANENKTNVEISKALKVNYNYVWKVVNEGIQSGEIKIKGSK
jgi:predicted transcriptional regulator